MLAPPKRRPGVSGISGLSFDSPFLSPLLLFSAQSSCSFSFVIFLLMVHSPDFSPRKLSRRFFCMALVEQLGDDSLQVVCAAYCHMALVFALIHLYNIFFIFYIVSYHSFFYIFLSPGIDKLDGMVDNTSMSQPYVFF